ncbi:hypothetical protein GR702_01410 [Novosphingobium sp. FGD1]|uniref:Holin n=1 Tax=Novosphingobium silvae TaxID=2692619 RepID=A0A7X4GD46_9SPHN|nr:hypothetical protein [Novosphingobium silvae]MYL96432.1 hypothetical protein [Novosphingobium silvae]
MIDRLKARLVPGARDWWRWSSVHFAVIGGAVTSWAASDPKGFAQVTALLPQWAQPLLGVVLAGTAIGLRITQRKDATHGR